MLIQFLHRSVRKRFHSLGFEIKSLDWANGSLHYLVRERAGAGRTLVLVHGIGTSSSTWLRVMPRLAGSHRIIALDLPGFGFSSANSTRGFSTLSEHVVALSALMEKVTNEPVILLGHSLGGWICCRYAAAAPERVRQLVLVDTAGVYHPGVEHVRDLFTLQSVDDTRRLLTTLWFRYPWYFKPFAGSIHHELTQRRMNDLVASIEATDFLADELARLAMPVNIIWGKQDAIFPSDNAAVLTDNIPRSSVHLIDRCGHVPQLERPEEFARILNQVLQT